MEFAIKLTVAILFLIGISWGVFHLNAAAELREEFEAVCSYEKGTVEGDVCIRDGEVILYKKTLDLEHQD